MTRGVFSRCWLSLCFVLPAWPLGAQQPAPMDTMVHAGHDMPQAPLGIPRTRDGSGTAWLPDSSPMHALHAQSGSWSLMLHGVGYLQYIAQEGDRGDDQFGSINWMMGMATRPLAAGELTLRAMLSAEPWTIPGCGYPILLATGELCDGEPLHDAQHPHDLFMELGGEYRAPLNDRLGLQLYGGLAGEPALGPVAFPHRPSAMGSPLAPIGHHWFDATHISFGVVTAGLYGRRWKAEGSVFNGREPDEERTDLDLARLDSYAGRAWFLPNDRWALQLSAGQLNEAEPGHDPGEARIDVTRYTASATYNRPMGGTAFWATTAAFGRNVEEDGGTNALLVESTLERDENLFFGRAELAEKSGHDLALTPALEEDEFTVGQVSLGYTRELSFRQGLLGAGIQGAMSFLPDALEPFYGGRNPMGLTLSFSIRPAPMEMEDMAGMGGMAAAHPMEGPAGMEHAPPEHAMEHDSMTAMQPMDSMAMGHGVMGDSAAMQHGAMQHEMMHGEPMPHEPGESAHVAGEISEEQARLLQTIHARMMADPVIRERVATDPMLQRLIQELDATMAAGHAMRGMGGAGASDAERAMDFVVQLLSNPAVEARIHADPELHRLWSDPEVQRRLAELRRQR